MTVLRHKSPCNQCPFRQKSAPGWLGASAPEEFMQQTLSGTHMPCHMSVYYDDPDWEEQMPDASHCAGSLIFLRNCGSQGQFALQDERLAEMQKICSPKADYTNVLVGMGHFIAHHTGQLRRKA